MDAWKRNVIAIAATSLCGLIGVTPADAELQLDPSFGTNGVVRVAFGTNNADMPRDLLVQPDGRILMAGKSDASDGTTFIAISRHFADGARDSAGFGVDGKVLQRFHFRDQVNGIDLTEEGKIVAAGIRMASTGVSSSAAAAYRFHADGSVDTTFGDGGFVDEWGDYLTGEYAGVKALPGGSVLAAGRRYPGYWGGWKAFVMRQYQPDGALSLAGGIDFELDGIGSCAFPDGGGVLLAYHADLNGRREFVLARLDGSGVPDPAFGINGVAKPGIPAVFASQLRVRILADGKILLAGTTQGDLDGRNFTALRFHADGTLDSSFGILGRVDVSFGTDDNCHDAVIDGNGRIILAGQAAVGYGRVGLARLLPDGSLDPTFSDDGKFTIDLNGGTGTHYLTRVAVLPDGAILGAGWDFVSNNGDFLLVKFRAPDVAAVGDEGASTGRLSALAYPNPSSGSTNVSFHLPRGRRVQVGVFDVAGRLVRRLFDGTLPSGAHSVRWDGCDDSGHAAAAGIYYAKIAGAEATQATRLVLVR